MNISDKARETVWTAERGLQDAFRRADAVEMAVTMRVLEAFRQERVSSRHFAPSTGYGYDDIARDTLDRVFALAMQAEGALVRPQFVNGSHALFTALAGLTEPGDTILSLSGAPYDTLEQAIGLSGDAPNSLKRLGIGFRAVALDEDGHVRLDDCLEALAACAARVVYLQRSRGYAWRSAISIADMEGVFQAIRNKHPDVTILVDNCYGEFVEAREPCAVGADLVAGSLIKNPGGGLAPTGGYVAGRADCVERVAQRLTLPGMGAEVGSYAGDYRPFYQGLFMAPHTVAQCVKGAALFAAVFESLGFETLPVSTAPRTDIIQALRFSSAEALKAFCRSIQQAAPVDSFAVPEPWDMPGYAVPVIMAAGTFVQGATSELSADGPMSEPYTAYLQGALSYAHARIAAMLACDALFSVGNA
ncbi:MAG: methionine gamma-lyase family protein [Clostridia bacterium]|nr:methionine gamma-lyase family protein [Clostridia bacterium]